MSVMTVTTHVSVKWYMRKTRDEILDAIKQMHVDLNLGRPDLLKYTHWDKHGLAMEAMRLHRLYPDEPAQACQVCTVTDPQLGKVDAVAAYNSLSARHRALKDERDELLKALQEVRIDVALVESGKYCDLRDVLREIDAAIAKAGKQS